MGHKTDQKARKKRREREAKRAIPPPKQQRPPVTAKELFDKKRELIAKNKADLDANLKRAPKPVQDEYERCITAIGRLMMVLPPGARVESARLYPNPEGDKTLSDSQVIALHALLIHPANGWQVRLDPNARELIFRVDPHED